MCFLVHISDLIPYPNMLSSVGSLLRYCMVVMGPTGSYDAMICIPQDR